MNPTQLFKFHTLTQRIEDHLVLTAVAATQKLSRVDYKKVK